MQEIQKHICERIEKIRSNLLDLTRRNPLLSTKFSDRSNSIVRVIDIPLKTLFESLQIKEMQILPLPALDDNPKDEDTEEFQMRLAEARINNVEYNDAISNFENDDEFHIQLIKAERILKDVLRVELNMPERQTNQNVSLQQHAKVNHINPSYDLPIIEDASSNDPTIYNHIQTLLLPDIYERRLNSLDSKDTLCREESGIPVLRAAFGFLEWQESGNSELCFAPLIILPVKLSKKRTMSGLEFSISGEEGAPETNRVLAEKLRLDFGINFPEYINQSVDEYLKQIEGVSPKNVKWRVRRWVVIGVFPSARLAMYRDLDTLGDWDFANHPIVSSLMVGATNNSDGTILYADEYDVDNPDVEKKVPLLVTDADSSQFSAIVDVMCGKNLAIEGPPGTGKSQTIVNTIAAALAEGKKVLFVAEKSAALEIVRSRLEACKLGEFLLPLQAQRSNKADVIASVKDRLTISDYESPDELESMLSKFKAEREKLAEYIQAISNKFGHTGMTTYQILGSGIANHEIIESLPRELLDLNLPEFEAYSLFEMDETLDLCKRFEKLLNETNQCSKYWVNITHENIDPFQANEIILRTEMASKDCHKAHLERSKLEKYGFSSSIPSTEINKLDYLISIFPKNVTNDYLDIAEEISTRNMTNDVEIFIEKANELLKHKEFLGDIIINPLEEQMVHVTSDLGKFMERFSLNGIDDVAIDQVISSRKNLVYNLEETLKILKQSNMVFSDFKTLNIATLITASDMIHNQPAKILSRRHKDLNSAEIKEIIERARNKSHNLRERKNKLEQSFINSETINKSVLEYHLDIFLNAGLFPIFSSKYRISKRFYSSISLKKDFNLDIAIKEMQELKNYIEELSQFQNQNKLHALLGCDFDGIETDFECFIAVCKLLSEIEYEFSSINHISIKNFLKFGSTDELLRIPKINSESPIRNFSADTYESIVHKIEFNKKELDELSNVSLKRKYFISGSKNLYNWTSHKLLEISSELHDFQDRWNSLFTDKDLITVFGEHLNRYESNFDFIKAILDISIKINVLQPESRTKFMMIAKCNLRIANFAIILKKIKDADANVNSAILRITELTGKPADSWAEIGQCNIIGQNLIDATKDKEGLITNSRLLPIVKELRNKGLGVFVDYILKRQPEFSNISQCFKTLVVRAMARAVYKSNGDVLAKYDGARLTELRNNVAKIDREIIKLYQRKLRSALVRNAQLPSGISGSAKKSEYTEMGLLRHQITLKQKFARVRDITNRAGRALVELKPCWMMSPLAVAQYIPKNTIIFDLVIIDEASQMRPEDAIGAIVRAKQVMIVGDTHQLPPSDFFRKIINDTSDDDESEDKVVTEESILEIANGVFRPVRQLRWHYRSVYAGLIAFSNKHIYRNNLILFMAIALN